MRYVRMCITLILMLMATVTVRAEVSVKVKDISFIDGLKENQIYGYGLVVGLQGTGDTRKSPLTKSSLMNLLKNLGMEGDEIFSNNTAAVIVTAQLPPFVRIGDRIDVTVSSIGDAKSLNGGILIQSPMRGADNNVYAVAQGPLSVSRVRGNRRGVKTVAMISNGALVEREIRPEIVIDNSIFLVLKKWDYSVASSIIKAVARKYADAKPELAPGGKIRINLVKDVDLPEFISVIENIEVTPVYSAKVVVNERDGTIVTGGDVKISESMVSREGLTVEIKDSEKKVSASLLKESSTVKELVDALNAVGADTTDMISILKALKAAGALHAELIIQ